MKQKGEGLTLWFTGLSASEKSTLAGGGGVANDLLERGCRVEILDGDQIRKVLSAGLGFTKADRHTNIRRLAFVSRLLSRNGVVAIVAAISPCREVREEVRLQEMPGRFVEVFVDAPLSTLVKRDPKGLYAKAMRGELENFTGVSNPYEPPERSEIKVRTDQQAVQESVASVLDWLEASGYVGNRS